MEIRKHTKTLGTLVIKPISRARAREMIIAGHYSHKWHTPFGKFSFGIFREGAEEEQDCLGVAAYGYMKNPKADIFTSAVPSGWMVELNRMWIDDCLGKNAETVLIGASLRLLRKLDPTIVAVQSFADGRIGCGTIYKASNFGYYGYIWSTFYRNKRSGEVVHEQCTLNSYNASGFFRSNALLLAGDMEAFRVKTYRYIYPLHPSFKFTGTGRLQPYPPYEKGTEQVQAAINPARLRPRLIAALDTLLDRYPFKRDMPKTPPPPRLIFVRAGQKSPPPEPQPSHGKPPASTLPPPRKTPASFGRGFFFSNVPAVFF